jgi:hypothetical protein
MTRGAGTRAVVGLLAVAVLAGCGVRGSSTTGGASMAPAGAAATATTGASAVSHGVTRADVGRCPVTRPRRWRPPEGVAPDALFGAAVAHGNGKLWVGGLGEGGVLEVGPAYVEPDGSVGMKFGWWRAVPGRLRISGRRLDGAAPPLRADVPDGYGDRGFQASGVWFPSEGCWEATGRVGSTSLTFVTFVVRQGAGP